MFKGKCCSTHRNKKSSQNAYQRGYNRAVKDYKTLEPFRHYPQRVLQMTNHFIKGKIQTLRDYVDGYEDAKQQLSQN